MTDLAVRTVTLTGGPLHGLSWTTYDLPPVLVVRQQTSREDLHHCYLRGEAGDGDQLVYRHVRSME